MQAVLELTKLRRVDVEQKIKDIDFGPISRKFRWRSAAPFLQLNSQQVEDIEVDGRREQERRMLTLRTWREMFGDGATYGMLMSALLQADLREQALHVGSILLRSLKPKSPLSSSSTEEEFSTPPQTPPLPPRYRHMQTQTEAISSSSSSDESSMDSWSLACERVVVANEYMPMPAPRLRRISEEVAAKTYLSTSSCCSKDSATQTDMPMAPTSSSSSPPSSFSNSSVAAMATLHPSSTSHAQSGRARWRTATEMEGIRFSRRLEFSTEKTICLLILVCLIIGILMLVVAIGLGLFITYS